jgi:hypothetical protein
MKGYIVRFNVNGVWNQSDPFRTKEAAHNYAEHLDRYGGINVGNVASTAVEREGHFADSGRFA